MTTLPTETMPVQSDPSRPVPIAAIERELVNLWNRKDPGSDMVTRACMSNLVVLCSKVAQAHWIPEEIAEIVRFHPARAIVLVQDDDLPGTDLDASVGLMCHMTGGKRKLCSEYVTVKSPSVSLRRIPSVTRSLLIGDLPTALWWAPSQQAPPLAGELFHELSDMVGQIIFESRGWVDPVHSVVATAEWAANDQSCHTLSDLEWRRMKPWRRLISQTLDPAVMPGALDSITDVRIEHGPHAVVKAWLLSGWLACRLGWRPERGKVAPGSDLSWNFRSSTGPLRITLHRLPSGEPKVKQVTISCLQDGKPTTIHFTRLGPGRLAVAGEDPNAPPRVLVVKSESRASLVARQLPDLARDSLFMDTLQVSRLMAESLPH
jgi:glucose-6-phosphate dehydrogenase assembly protein OpcA